MEFRIKETGELKELKIYDDNNIEWTADLLGSYGALHYDEETEEHVLSQNDYNWWEEYIENHEQDEAAVTELSEELDLDESDIWDRINQELNCDLGDEHNIIQNVLKEIKKERKGL